MLSSDIVTTASATAADGAGTNASGVAPAGGDGVVAANWSEVRKNTSHTSSCWWWRCCCYAVDGAVAATFILE